MVWVDMAKAAGQNLLRYSPNIVVSPVIAYAGAWSINQKRSGMIPNLSHVSMFVTLWSAFYFTALGVYTKMAETGEPKKKSINAHSVTRFTALCSAVSWILTRWKVPNAAAYITAAVVINTAVYALFQSFRMYD